jgi:hypothetical protein
MLKFGAQYAVHPTYIKKNNAIYSQNRTIHTKHSNTLILQAEHLFKNCLRNFTERNKDSAKIGT